MVLRLTPHQPKRVGRPKPMLIWHQEVSAPQAPLPLFISVWRGTDGVDRCHLKIGNKHGRETTVNKIELTRLIDRLMEAQSKMGDP